MEREGLDVLVVYGNSGRQGPRTGNLAYVSNFISFSGQQILVFPRRGRTRLVRGGGEPTNRIPAKRVDIRHPLRGHDARPETGV